MNIIALISILVALDPITFGDAYDAYAYTPTRGTRRANTARAIARKRRACVDERTIAELRFNKNHVRTYEFVPDFDEEGQYNRWDTFQFNTRYNGEFDINRHNIGNTTKSKSYKERKALQACNSKLKDF